MDDASMDQPHALVGLELAKLERMHDGERMFFAGLCGNGLAFLLKRAEGVSPAGRELWTLSLARRRRNAGTRTGNASGTGRGHPPFRDEA